MTTYNRYYFIPLDSEMRCLKTIDPDLDPHKMYADSSYRYFHTTTIFTKKGERRTNTRSTETKI